MREDVLGCAAAVRGINHTGPKAPWSVGGGDQRAGEDPCSPLAVWRRGNRQSIAHVRERGRRGKRYPVVCRNRSTQAASPNVHRVQEEADL
jgi:hypothetical protein